MKNLMSTINTTLQDSLLRNSRAGSLQSDMVTPESSDSMRSTSPLYSDNKLTVLYLDPQPYQTVQPVPERNRTPPTDLKLRKMILFTGHLVLCRQRNMRWGRLLTDKKFPQRFRSCPATATSLLMQTVISQHLVRALQVSPSKFLKSRNLPASVQH